ncbi:ribosomal L1 domain-containing protein 1-like [Penaeus chinensis]|uniref:ribosomal L1 domain-containing protein 1-like n=1 Tax=Penaeus chinensis TaxID=139456 RepID=UPI001FB67343|nr:ribosomal L1 domain-containing protein 1-like [Penaeus chinensis]
MAPAIEKKAVGKKKGLKGVMKKKPGLTTIAKKSSKEARRERLMKAKMWEHRIKGSKKKSKAGGKKTIQDKSAQESKMKKVEADPHLSELSEIQVRAAVAGVRKLCNKLVAESKELLEVDSDQHICLQVSLCKVPKNKDKRSPLTIKIPLPHPVLGDDTDVLLITRMLDSERGPDYEKTLNHFKELLIQKKAAHYITEVITLKQLRMEYKEFEAKRNLANRFQVILGQDCIMELLPKLLGKHFYGRNKLPIAVNLNTKHLKSVIENAVRQSILHFNMTGNCSQVKVGRLSQNDEQVTENILKAVGKMIDRIPGGWGNIQTLSLKGLKTKSVPLYVRTTTFDEKIKLPEKEGESTAVGPLTTLHKRKLVYVKKDGNIKIKLKG